MNLFSLFRKKFRSDLKLYLSTSLALLWMDIAWFLFKMISSPKIVNHQKIVVWFKLAQVKAIGLFRIRDESRSSSDDSNLQ